MILNYLRVQTELLFSEHSSRFDGLNDTSCVQGARENSNTIYMVDPASVICLSQILSHASARTKYFVQQSCEWLDKTAIICSELYFTRITVVILELIRANKETGKDPFVLIVFLVLFN